MKKFVPYIIMGAIVAVVAFFALPFTDMMWTPGTSYAEGIHPVNVIWAVILGVLLSVSLYRGDRSKREAADSGKDSRQDNSIEID